MAKKRDTSLEVILAVFAAGWVTMADAWWYKAIIAAGFTFLAYRAGQGPPYGVPTRADSVSN